MVEVRVRGVIFDWGNTLVDVDLDWDAVRRAKRRALLDHLSDRWGLSDPVPLVDEFRRVRLDYRERSLRELFEHDDLRALREALSGVGMEAPAGGRLREALDAFYAPEVEAILPFPDAAATLETLRARGHALAVASNNPWSPPVRETLRRAGIAPLLDVEVHSSEVGFRKPDPAMFRFVLRRWGFGPSEVAMVGDRRDRDVLGAQRLGMRAVWARMRPEGEIGAEAASAEADAEIRALSELLDLLAP